MVVLGVDAFPKGWVGVAWDGPGSVPVVTHAAQFNDLVDAVESGLGGRLDGAAPLACIGVDIPIGLPERGERRSDAAVRAVLGARRSSLFATPVRAAVLIDDWDEAQALQRALGGKGMSKQSHALRHGIRQIAGWAQSTGRRAYEVHPELSFAVLASGSDPIAPAHVTPTHVTPARHAGSPRDGTDAGLEVDLVRRGPAPGAAGPDRPTAP
jgi:predicted RNase H-like nuclease